MLDVLEADSSRRHAVSYEAARPRERTTVAAGRDYGMGQRRACHAGNTRTVRSRDTGARGSR
jgi:hypothetical protein